MSAWEAVGSSDEWYTPHSVFKALDCWFDMDVAPARHDIGHVPCEHRLVGDGLVEPWFGFVWMNPPFGGRNALRPWLAKFFDHGDGIALTPDRTSAPWFQEAWPRTDTVLFVREKIKFIRPDGSIGKQPGTGTALWAIGEQGRLALARAERAGFGIVAA